MENLIDFGKNLFDWVDDLMYPNETKEHRHERKLGEAKKNREKSFNNCKRLKKQMKEILSQPNVHIPHKIEVILKEYREEQQLLNIYTKEVEELLLKKD